MSAALQVVAPGLHTTLQDRGRLGYQDVGMPVSGPLDDVSLRLANALVGNPLAAAALEILWQGPTLEVAADSVRVALTGTGGTLEILGEAARRLPAWRSVRLTRGQVFRIGALPDSACAYLAVEGGFAVAPCLGSAATYVRGAIGGLNGAALPAGAALPLRLERVAKRGEVMLARPLDLGLERQVRVVLGPQQDHFTADAIETLLSAEFKISANADRMGYRLDGPRLAHRDGYNIVSDGLVTGSIQVPGSGRAIVLLADHQTTGGYPKIATVISADLPLVGRRRPGMTIRFAAVEVAEAEEIRRRQEAVIQRLAARLEPAGEEGGLVLRSLYSENLISGIVSATDETAGAQQDPRQDSRQDSRQDPRQDPRRDDGIERP